MLDSLFEFLFAYRPVVFQQGEFRFQPPAGAYAAAALAVLAIGAAILSYRALPGRLRGVDRAVLMTLRAALIGVLLFCLLRPVLIVRAAVPQQNVLAVLVDDSRSMRIADAAGRTRGEVAKTTFAAPEAPVVRALSDRFLVRLFRFSTSTSRVGSPADLTFDGRQTRVAAALEGARQELEGLPVAGLVLVTDGADTSDASVADALLAPKADAVPVFTVGLGRETLSRDIQIGRINTPRTVLKGTSLLVDAIVTQTGYAGETVVLDVQDEGRVVGSQQVKLPADGEPTSVRVRFTASTPGPRVFTLRVAPQPGEEVTQNNERQAVIDVRDRRDRILYFEGEPRFEPKFIRRAVADDPNLQVVTLQRTAENKYLRLDVDKPDELLGGFPRTREELFAYRGLILGSIEASAFTGDQLRMIAEFVDVRGGGLLMLGGRHAFAEGGYAGTPLADVLPVTLGRAGDGSVVEHLKVAPTRAGEAHAVTQLGDSDEASADKWKSMPPLTSVNDVTAVKPGATVLLSGTDQRRRNHVVLAFQRYGRGKAIAFTPQDSWLWQMHASIPLEDEAHETFWRQLLRWVVDGVPDEVETRPDAERVEPGDPVTLTTDVVDKRFVELNDAQVIAHITSPSGAKTDVPLQWTGERDGQYRGTFTTSAPGWYETSVEAQRDGKTIGTSVSHVRAAPGDAEYFDAGMHGALLRRIAEETGGQFYTADTVRSLPEDVRYSSKGVTTIEERDLWHMPVLLIAALALMCGEWGYRRIRGLA